MSSGESETGEQGDAARYALANQLFFRLYQCANMLHKTGTRAVEHEGLTTQRWAVLGALSRPEVGGGMAVGDLARYLKVTRQSLSGITNHLERGGLVTSELDPNDRRSRLLRLTAAGTEKWHERALPNIYRFYDQAASGLSLEDMSQALRYLTRLIENMTAIDEFDDAADLGDPSGLGTEDLQSS